MNKKNNSILCIVAHPDDEALGVGGTLIRHINNGDIVNIVIFSIGEDSKIDKSPDSRKRINSAKKWSEFIGSKLYKLFSYPDQMLDTIPKLEIIKKIEDIVVKIRPDIVYTHHEGDINHDHQIISHAVLTALRPMNPFKIHAEIRTFETVSSTDQAPYVDKYIFKPNYYGDIENVWEKKISSLKFYRDELALAPHPRSIDNIKALAIKRGAESGLHKAEAFCIIKKIWK